MLERAVRQAPAETDEASRPVAFRGAGFAPGSGRYAGWVALLAAIALWQLAGQLSLVNPIFLPTPLARSCARFISSPQAAHFGITCHIR
jgi:NitT/TauT family transport system permease protein